MDTLIAPTPETRQAAPDGARYHPGDVLVHSWGYDQTNIDYFLVVKRTTSPKGIVMLTLAEMTAVHVPRDGDPWRRAASGHSVPGVVKPGGEVIRRKLHAYNRREYGCAIRKSYGWASSWDGRPDCWTAYA